MGIYLIFRERENADDLIMGIHRTEETSIKSLHYFEDKYPRESFYIEEHKLLD